MHGLVQAKQTKVPPSLPLPLALVRQVQAAQEQSLHLLTRGMGEGREGAPWFVLPAPDHACVPLWCVAFWGVQH